ncbi:response regulator [Mesorhizobium sp. WSM3224]|uniref:response regulator n=1 Tax=Mesorhizobium sp. WSM3224 TaxID=1040986 RepID=UPI001FDAC745|nr:response regulator [Mesorhizobium sp. WSM3224]
MIVEDESILLLDIENSLREAEFEVLAFYNGVEAIAAFDRDPDRIAALLTDIRLGDGPTGWDIARHLRGANPTLPVIYMTGDGAEDWPSLGVPNSLMITKPFVMPQIITGLAALLNQQGVEQLSG